MLTEAAQQCISNHSLIVGRLSEAKDILEMLFPASAPVVEGVLDVAKAVEEAVNSEEPPHAT